MLFHSAIFLFAFLPLTWLVFRGLASLGRRQLALGWVVLMSLVFYGYWNPAYLALIVISIAVNFTIGSRITPDGGLREGSRRWLLYAGLAFNLGLLGYYKYANFFVDSLRGLTGCRLTSRTSSCRSASRSSRSRRSRFSWMPGRAAPAATRSSSIASS